MSQTFRTVHIIKIQFYGKIQGVKKTTTFVVTVFNLYKGHKDLIFAEYLLLVWTFCYLQTFFDFAKYCLFGGEIPEKRTFAIPAFPENVIIVSMLA